MSPDVLRRRLGQLRRYLDDLRPYVAVSDVARRENRYAIERLLELVVGAMIDVSFHLVRMRGLSAPTSCQEGFSLLAAKGILPSDLSERLEKAAGFRNLLVHEYGDLDEQKVLAAIAPALQDGEAFFRTVTGLTKPETPDVREEGQKPLSAILCDRRDDHICDTPPPHPTMLPMHQCFRTARLHFLADVLPAVRSRHEKRFVVL